ncbi:unnamed protein product [Meganyctiphanes norvegica]|uniref:C-type lectin domain-containing protein n=1 Tax=Meganyctiphanes norvegica TaxID=48144 RepID=A0AAV2QG31_MEGNR
MWLTPLQYLVFVFMIQIQNSVQRDGKTSNTEIKDLILNMEQQLGEMIINLENRIDAKLSDLQRKISNHVEDEVSRILDNKLKSHIRNVLDLQLELVEKSLRNVSDDLVLIKDTVASHCQDLKEDVSQNITARFTVDAQSITDNITTSLGNTQLTHLNGCSEIDGFLLSPSGHCFKVIKEYHDWPSSKNRCESEGLVLAQPEDTDAPWLQIILNETYYDSGPLYYVNGHLVGSVYQWGNGEVVPDDHPLWYPGDDEGAPRQPHRFPWIKCMLLSTWSQYMRHHPGRPYRAGDCTVDVRVPLCQVKN